MYVRTYVCICLCVCVCMYVCMYVCTYVCFVVLPNISHDCQQKWPLFAAGHDLGKELYVNRSGKSKLEPCESEHDIRIRVCTVRANYFVAVFLFSFAVRTECFECRSEAQQ